MTLTTSPPPRLASGLWVHACIRRCMHEGLHATQMRKGDPDAGAILIKVFRDRLAFKSYFLFQIFLLPFAQPFRE